ncbi:MAG: glycoside hydrolase family 3 N-terminal domain-containing protein [candidate division Zixibacteria bacterium]|nr:glycoside hydrolase family 3 N-terminal domain-containing protein [candidate division Zixibacteria bacterium]
MEKIRKQLGQLFILGFPGAKPPDQFLSFISEEKIGGVILFEENCPGYQATLENIETIRRALQPDNPFIAIDQEGGRVCRLRGAPAEYQAAADYGQLGNVERFTEDYSRSAGYMESLGINLNFTPVADIFLNPANSCLAGRCFGDNPELVSRFVLASIQVSNANGLLSCAKHFPGLGDTGFDPHIATAESDYDQFVWNQREKVPFSVAIKAGVDLIMTTHLRLPKLDSKIVTGSSKIINTLLRGELDFDGPVITDDLTMAGADELGSFGERTVAAFQAGHDMLLYGRNYEASMEAFDYFVESVDRGEIDHARLRSSLQRVGGLKYKLERSLLR